MRGKDETAAQFHSYNYCILLGVLVFLSVSPVDVIMMSVWIVNKTFTSFLLVHFKAKSLCENISVFLPLFLNSDFLIVLAYFTLWIWLSLLNLCSFRLALQSMIGKCTVVTVYYMTILQIWLHEVHNNSFAIGNSFIECLRILSCINIKTWTVATIWFTYFNALYSKTCSFWGLKWM